ncbi:MAG: ABC transporter permease [Tissierellia bacterium]|nr:ABC transporter permease [Tissierellia bacterium]
MTVFKAFLKNMMAMKFAFISYLIIFGIIAFINGGNAGNIQSEFDEVSLNIAVVDHSESELSKSLIDYLKDSNQVEIVDESYEKLKEMTYLAKYDVALIIPDNFEEKVIGKQESIISINPAKSASGELFKSKLKTFFSAASIVAEGDGFDTKALDLALKENVDVEFVNSNIERDSRIGTMHYFNYASYIITAILIMIIGEIMVAFNSKNIIDRVRVSKISAQKYNLSIYSSQLLVGLITLIFIIAIAVVVAFVYDYEINILNYILNLSVYSVSIIAMVNLIFNIKADKNMIRTASTIISLGLAFISGVMVPQIYLSKTVLNVARLFPNYYFIKANDAIYNSEGYGIYLLIMTAFAIMYFLVGTIIAKMKSGELK